jgi:hypothetical protein
MKIGLATRVAAAQSGFRNPSGEINGASFNMAGAEPRLNFSLGLACRGLSPITWFLVTGPTPIGQFFFASFISRGCYGVGRATMELLTRWGKRGDVLQRGG